MEKFKKIIKENYSYILIIIVILLIRTYIVTPIRVNGTSMYPTLKQNEIMILNKIVLKSGIDRFDIVVVKTDNNRIIKRVIGLPGESVMYEDGKLYINGKYVEDSYSLSKTKDFDNIVLKEDEYFVLGDNREVSKDSRMIGPIKKEQILGKTRLVIFPFTKIRMEK